MIYFSSCASCGGCWPAPMRSGGHPYGRAIWIATTAAMAMNADAKHPRCAKFGRGTWSTCDDRLHYLQRPVLCSLQRNRLRRWPRSAPAHGRRGGASMEKGDTDERPFEAMSVLRRRAHQGALHPRRSIAWLSGLRRWRARVQSECRRQVHRALEPARGC